MDINKLLEVIREGENERIEFKKTATPDIAREICAMANAEGGYILIGVTDEGKIAGCNVKKAKETITSALQNVTPPLKVKMHVVNLEGRDILVVEVPKSSVLCSIGGVAYIRVGTGIRPLSIQEIVMLSSELGTITWDEFPVAEISEIKEEYVEWFFNSMKRARGREIPRENWNRYLRSVRAIKGNKLTNAGVLFFTDVKEFIPYAGGRIIKVAEGEPVWSREFEGPIWKVIDEMYNELMSQFKVIEVIVGTRRVKIPEYPPRAIREAIVNAFAHRNYAIPSDVKIFIHSDKLIVRNPGGLMPGVDLEDPEHVPRNPNLCTLLYDTGYIEKYGYGLKLIREECKKHSLVEVEFKSSANKFEVIFRKKGQELLDDIDKRILEFLAIPRRTGEISEYVGLSKPAVLKRLERLEALGLVRAVGRGAHRKYVAGE
ncbi:transcriptional regulator [Thermococci archaeon]|nr:MAG: transcriptional regulator [Thermococci archaeon]